MSAQRSTESCQIQLSSAAGDDDQALFVQELHIDEYKEIPAENMDSHSTSVQLGDLLVLMVGNASKTSPGHPDDLDSYSAQSMAGGNMRVVEATGAPGANPKLLDSMFTVEKIIPKGGATPVMILVV